jgi:hypothetical protein
MHVHVHVVLGRLARLTWSDLCVHRSDVNPQHRRSVHVHGDMDMIRIDCNSPSAQKQCFMISESTPTFLPHEQRRHKPSPMPLKIGSEPGTTPRCSLYQGQAARKSVEMVDSNTCFE